MVKLSSILYDIGCLGKITSFKRTEDSRYLIELKGIIRFKIIKELESVKQYRQCNVDFQRF
jgi:Lon protease-like protein